MGDSLAGKVAIVTGAGRGLGRAEALELARQGARVVVNDYGVWKDGTGSSQEPAEQVVEEIKSFGGEAITAYGDVGDWNDTETTVKKAIDTFGDLHIVVNNAGFCRDRMIFNMSEEEFDAVIRVHLKGHFNFMRMATGYWRERSKGTGAPVYGRLINTASEAFLFGSVGQPNYAAAKGGIVAMTLCAAQAMLKYGVTANAICPRALTSMTEDGLTGQMFAKPEEGFHTFAPENVAPLVAYLASPMAGRVSGYVLCIWGKEVTLVNAPSLGTQFQSEDPWTVEGLDQKLSAHFEGLEPIRDGFLMT